MTQKHKIVTVRMEAEGYEFIRRLSKEQKEEVSKALRGLVEQGRVMLAIEKYRAGKASIGKASELAGVSISEMMDLLEKFGVKSNVEYEDYLEGLKNIRKHWKPKITQEA